MRMTGDLANPPPGAPLTALAIPLFVGAGAVQGIAIALARAGDELWYLVDNAPADGPPVWVHEGAVETCTVVTGIARHES
jgi:hypothetical protein